MRGSCPSVLSRCPDGALAAAAAAVPRRTRLCGGPSPVSLVRRREYVVRWLRGPAVVAEGRFRGH